MRPDEIVEDALYEPTPEQRYVLSVRENEVHFLRIGDVLHSYYCSLEEFAHWAKHKVQAEAIHQYKKEKKS